MKYAILAVLFLMAAVCFGQTDSADMAVTAKVTQRKAVDTSISFETFRMTKTVPRNKTFKVRIAGTSIDTVILRVIDAKPKPLANGDTLKVDSIQVFLKVEVREIWGLRSTGGPIVPGTDTVIILNNIPAIR
jgi:hypothetical protein